MAVPGDDERDFNFAKHNNLDVVEIIDRDNLTNASMEDRQGTLKNSSFLDGLPVDAAVLTTQKDWVKLRVPDLAGRELWAVRIGLHFRDGEEAFAAALDRVLK